MNTYQKHHIIILIFISMLVRISTIWASDPNQPMLLGGDISMLSCIEDHGGQFKQDGQVQDMITILRSAGWNCFRLRLFVNPNHKNQVVNDLPYTLALAKRIKKSGASLLLDFHYSDTWADPGHQHPPVAWEKLDFPALEKQVYSYTADVIRQFKKNNCLPEYVQIGNEIRPGFLWPLGRLTKDNRQRQWDQFARLLIAGEKGLRSVLAPDDKVQTMIHIDCGGDWPTTNWFYTNLDKRNVPYDLIGLSYYPFYHGPFKQLKDNLAKTAGKFKKPVIVVETAYPWTDADYWQTQSNMDFPFTPQGQKDFLVKLVECVQSIPENRGRGVIYWYPESIPTKGLNVWNGGNTAVFDHQGNALPAVDAFRDVNISAQ